MGDAPAITEVCGFRLERMTGGEGFAFNLFGRHPLGSRITARIGRREAALEDATLSRQTDENGPHWLWTLRFVAVGEGVSRSFEGRIRIHASGLEESHEPSRNRPAGLPSGQTEGGWAVFETIHPISVAAKKGRGMSAHPYIAFPCFDGDLWDEDLSMMTFNPQQPFNMPERWRGRATGTVRDGRSCPLSGVRDNLETFVLSPMNHLLHGTVSVSRVPSRILCGLPRAVRMIPTGTVSRTILVWGNGANATWRRWGRRLQWEHRTAPARPDGDVLLTHLSYWTNAGSAYWYRTWRNRSYLRTIAELKARHEELKVTYGSYQLDSWWYQRENDTYTAGFDRTRSLNRGRKHGSATLKFASAGMALRSCLDASSTSHGGRFAVY